MQWLTFNLVIVMSLLWGNSYCNRFLDSRLRSTYFNLKDLANTLKEDASDGLTFYNENSFKMPKNSFKEKFIKDLDTLADCTAEGLHFEENGKAASMDNGFYGLFNSQSKSPKSHGSDSKGQPKQNFYGDSKLMAEGINRHPFNKEGKEQTQLKGIDMKRLVPQLPVSYYSDFYNDLVLNRKNEDVKKNKMSTPPANCDCKVKNDLVDLGADHFPRFLLNAVCQNEPAANEYEAKCAQGAYCRPLEYKVKVLTFRMEHLPNDNTFLWLPDDLRHLWKFKTVTVAAGCFCGA